MDNQIRMHRYDVYTQYGQHDQSITLYRTLPLWE